MKRWLPYLVSLGVIAPWLYFVAIGEHPVVGVTAALTGVAILSAAFLLSWACEVAEMDVPRALAVSVLALVAVLPEYAVDATFAWKAARDPVHAGYAVANMTGGNRLLLGLGWPLVVFLGWLRFRQKQIEVPRDMGVEVIVLLAATVYSAVPILRGSLSLVDTAVYGVMYILYLIAAARGEEHEAEPVGPAQVLAELPTAMRRISILVLLVFAALVIGVSAEPFAESLVASGRSIGMDEFLLVQWVAPLASESPEVVVAVLMVLRGHSATGLRTLVSSKVNQWTLLIGTLALVYSISHGSPASMPIDDRQRDELLLTAAQSLFGVAVLADLRFTLLQGALLAFLFVFQVVFVESHFWVGVGYLVLTAVAFVFDGRVRRGFVSCGRTFFAMLLGRPMPS